MPPSTADKSIESIVREEWGRLLASLIRVVGDIQLAEDCLQDALESALVHWKRNGAPASPAGWLLKVGQRKAIDRIRRSKNFERKQAQYSHLLQLEQETSPDMEEHEIPEERLRLIFTCCHPALDEKSRIALTLRTLGGLNTAEIASAFLTREETMAQRIVRAKRKIRVAGIPYSVPGPELWNERLSSVLGVLYLIFNEGYYATSGDTQIRQELSDEAIRLARAVNMLKPGEPEIEGLLALMLLHDSRRSARFQADGSPIPLEHQDRSKWNKNKILEGHRLVKQALERGQTGPYQVQAAISAVHAQARSIDQTDWKEIVLLYDVLHTLSPNPVVLLNRSVALSFAASPEAALQALAELEDELSRYQPFHAARADFLKRSGDLNQAAESYKTAIELAPNEQQRKFLQSRLREVLN